MFYDSLFQVQVHWKRKSPLCLFGFECWESENPTIVRRVQLMRRDMGMMLEVLGLGSQKKRDCVCHGSEIKVPVAPNTPFYVQIWKLENLWQLMPGVLTQQQSDKCTTLIPSALSRRWKQKVRWSAAAQSFIQIIIYTKYVSVLWSYSVKESVFWLSEILPLQQW